MLAKHTTKRTCCSCDGHGSDCWRCAGSGEATFCAHCGEPGVGDEHCSCPHCGSMVSCGCEEQLRTDEQAERDHVRDNYR